MGSSLLFIAHAVVIYHEASITSVMLAMWTYLALLYYQRAGRLFLVLAHTAGLDPELSALWERARGARLQDCRRLVELTGRRSRPLRDRLTDLLFVHSGPGVYADLVGDRHWTDDDYQSWLAATVQTLLASS